MSLIYKLGLLLRKPFFYTPLVSKIDRNIPLGIDHSYTNLSFPDSASIIRERLNSDQPCMIARFGRVELQALTRIHFMLEKKPLLKKVADFLLFKNNGFTIETSYLMRAMKNNAGFFPLTKDTLLQYYNLCINDIPECDLLASWSSEERIFHPFFKHTAVFMPFCLGSFLTFSAKPWTIALQGKKVLVIHPFAKTIEHQYQTKRHLIFPKNPDVLPEFQLETLCAVQSIADEKTPFATWFDALEYMKNEINKKDFDIALIGCGAYGFNLAAHVKRIGKKAVHVGGDLQYLFGIYGEHLFTSETWDNVKTEAWVRPAQEEQPKGFKKVEGGCYW